MHKFKILISRLSQPLFLSVLLPDTCAGTVPSIKGSYRPPQIQKALFMGRCTTSRAVTGGKLRSSIAPFSDFILDFLSIIHLNSVLLQLLPLMWYVLSKCETCKVQEGLSEEPRIWELLILMDSLRYSLMIVPYSLVLNGSQGCDSTTTIQLI